MTGNTSHPSGSWDPVSNRRWIPAFAGMTMIGLLLITGIIVADDSSDMQRSHTEFKAGTTADDPAGKYAAGLNRVSPASDPKKEQERQAMIQANSAGTTIADGISSLSSCSYTYGAGCIKGAVEIAGGAAEAVMAGISLANAKKLDNNNLTEITADSFPELKSTIESLCKRNPTVCNGKNIDTSALEKDLQRRIAEAKKALADARAKGIDVDDILAHPEKYDAENIMKNAKNSSDIDKELNDKNSQESDRSLASEEVTEQSSEKEKSKDDFDFDFSKFLAFFDSYKSENQDLSAPGYYGNVSLKTLDPSNKKSLFERVSIKIHSYYKGGVS